MKRPEKANHKDRKSISGCRGLGNRGVGRKNLFHWLGPQIVLIKDGLTKEKKLSMYVCMYARELHKEMRLKEATR